MIQFDTPQPPEVFERCASILRVAWMERPALVGDIMFITSGYRERRPGDKFSYHQESRAIDIRVGTNLMSEPGAIIADTRDDVIELATLWAQRCARRLGNEHDVVYGAAVDHIDHMHIEHDGKKARRVFLEG